MLWRTVGLIVMMLVALATAKARADDCPGNPNALGTSRVMTIDPREFPRIGMVQYTEDDEYFIGRDMMRRKSYSEATAQEIDSEVRAFIKTQYQRAHDLIHSNRDKLEVIANSLLEFETLDGSQMKEIVEHGRLVNPPPGTAPPPGKKMPAEKPPKQVVAAPDVTPPLPGALGGAPA